MNDNTWQVSGYTHVRELGAGASGRVVLATHEDTGVPVAIKYLSGQLAGDPSFREAFRREARLLAEIEDPHVARLYEYVESAQGAAIVMELVDGVSLREMLRAHGPTEPESALCVLKGSLLGLAAAHEHGVVHRDYKPENVLVTGEGESKLADFGIAMPVGHEANEITGTPRYMAPEQWTGEPATPACDIYAATATFYECLTGRPPYDGGGDLTVLRRQHEQAQIPTDPAPPPLHGLLRDGLAKQPGDRPQHALAFLQLLEVVAIAGYGAGWEETGRRKLAERAALLAALFPLGGNAGGGTAVAATVFGTGTRLGKKALIAAGTAAALLLGGIGLSYASDDDPKVVVVSGSPTPTTTGRASATPNPSPTPSPTASVSPTASASTSATPRRTVSYRPPSRTPSSTPVTTSSPTPGASTSPSPSPSADTTPPSVGSLAANPNFMYHWNCPNFTSSTISAVARDDRTPLGSLRMRFTYTLDGVKWPSVAMSYQANNTFSGTLSNLPQLKEQAKQIPIYVIAMDAAGNSTRAGPVYVTLYSQCTVG